MSERFYSDSGKDTPENDTKQVEREDSWIERIRKRLQRMFEKEKIELPPISIDILYAPHASSFDARGFEEHFKRADIYFPEGIFDKRAQDTYQKISGGEITPQEAFAHPDSQLSGFYRSALETLYGSQKPVAFVDVPKRSALGMRIVHSLEGDLFKIIGSGNFEKALEAMRAHERVRARLQKEREEYMISQLVPTIKEILRRQPELRKKLALIYFLHWVVFILRYRTNYPKNMIYPEASIRCRRFLVRHMSF
jgi:hypothetical protein